jgi:hypothetical protein
MYCSNTIISTTEDIIKYLVKVIPTSFLNLIPILTMQNKLNTTKDSPKLNLLWLYIINIYYIISTQLLKSGVNCIRYPLNHACIHSMTLGFFPETLKHCLNYGTKVFRSVW